MFPKTLLIACLATLTAQARPWTDDVIYFAMTDRFCDGDESNNVPVNSDPALYDPSQQEISHYLGGDLRGVEKSIAAGYFNKLGVTAIWLTPVVRNVWRSGYDLGGWKSGYHGYWTQDWLDIDPHLTSKTSLTGEPYPDSAEGRMEHYRDFVKLAHSKGIKIIQDVVLNHAGPVFYYDVNHDGKFQSADKSEWIQPFKKNGFHDNAQWIDLPQWNARKAQPDGPRELLGATIHTTGAVANLASYGRKGFSSDSLGKSDGEEMECDFFSLRDFWTAPGSATVDALVNDFVEIYAFYLTTVGVDGLRIDTIKHVHHGFWDAFTKRLRERLGPAAAEKILFGEIYDGNPAKLGEYTWPSDWPKHTAPVLDSVLDFNLCFNAREYLRKPGAAFGPGQSVEKSLSTRDGGGQARHPFYNPNPGADGLNSRQKIISFIENHDGLNRFRVEGITAERNRLAQALLLTLPGIPCLYYGSEFDLLDARGRIGQDGETGRMMFFRRAGGPSIADVEASPGFQSFSKLSTLRSKLPELRTGSWTPLWSDSSAGPDDDGVVAFARTSSEGTVVVVVNASDKDRVTSAGGQAMHLPATILSSGKILRRIFASNESPTPPDVPAEGPLQLPVAASSIAIYQLLSK